MDRIKQADKARIAEEKKLDAVEAAKKKVSTASKSSPTPSVRSKMQENFDAFAKTMPERS